MNMHGNVICDCHVFIYIVWSKFIRYVFLYKVKSVFGILCKYKTLGKMVVYTEHGYS